MHFNFRRFLGAAVLLTLALAACQPAAPAPTATSLPPTQAPTEPAPALETAAAPTATSLVLEDAVITDSGLQYLQLIPGDGKTPEVGDIITIQYIATLPDGTELANTYLDNKPLTTVWGRDSLLPGWEEGIGLMKVNGKSRLVLSPELAFGAEGSGGVPPNSQVVIEVELLAAEPAPLPIEVADSDLATSTTGLQYFDIKVGDGAEAAIKSSVTTFYTMWVKTESGYDYISSSRGEAPVSFVVGRRDVVFPGWEEGVTGMKVGGKRYLVVPPALGLGDQALGVIPANSTLVMEIELLDASEPRVPTSVEEKDFTVTESGLKFYDLVAGEGETPAPGSTVLVHYTGWLEDGTQFDSSVESGQPFTFTLGAGNVIPGWDEGVATMKVGGKRQLIIPAELGYGDAGAGGVIPPGATLIFEVELLEIQK